MEFLTIFNLKLILNSFLVIKCINIKNPQIKHLILQLSKIKQFSNKEKKLDCAKFKKISGLSESPDDLERYITNIGKRLREN